MYLLKFFCVLILVLIYTNSAKTQDHLLEVQSGYVLSFPNTSSASDNPYKRSGLEIGLSYTYQTKKILFFNTGLMYMNKGRQSNYLRYDHDINQDTYIKSRNNRNFIGIPLNLGLSWGNKFYFHIKLGVTPELLVNANHRYTKEYKADQFPKEVVLVETTNDESRFNIYAQGELGFGGFIKDQFKLGVYFKFFHDIIPNIYRSYAHYQYHFEERRTYFYGPVFGLSFQYGIKMMKKENKTGIILKEK